MSACYCVALCCYVTMLGKCAARVLLRTAFVHYGTAGCTFCFPVHAG
jgi:hypothetical protein